MAEIMLRQRDGLQAAEELVYRLGPAIEKRLKKAFPNRPNAWEEVQEEFLRKITLRPPKAERAAEATAFATKVAYRLLLDRIRRPGEPLIFVPKKGEGGKFRDPLDQVADKKPPPSERESEAVEAAKAALQLSMIQVFFSCPPNPPHQSMAWAYKTLLECGLKTMVENRLVDLPLEQLLKRFLREMPTTMVTGHRWADVTKPIRDSLQRVAGGVLHDPVHKRIYQHLLSRKCGDTCLRDYKTGESEERSEPGGSQRDRVLEGNLSDWVLKVNVRSRHEGMRLIYDPPDDPDGPSGPKGRYDD